MLYVWDLCHAGQAQRAVIALSVATEPAVLLLDEPTSACDPVSTVLVEKAIEASNASVVWVSHDPAQPGRVGGRIYQLN